MSYDSKLGNILLILAKVDGPPSLNPERKRNSILLLKNGYPKKQLSQYFNP